MNISLPEPLKAFVEEQVAARGYGTSSEFVRELIRREQDRTKLRELLLEGAASSPAGAAAFFRELRDDLGSVALDARSVIGTLEEADAVELEESVRSLRSRWR